jgi:hypothetical protein
MTRKVVIAPEDFARIQDFINSMPVPFAMVEQASEVKKAMKNIQLMDIEIKEPQNNNENERG